MRAAKLPVLTLCLLGALAAGFLIHGCREISGPTAPSGTRAGVSARATAGAAAAATQGTWTAPFPWPIVAVHLHLLPNGKVLSFGLAGVPQVWDPGTRRFTPVPSPSKVFCAGHAFLPDGRLLVTGGNLGQHLGLPNANLFDFRTQAWTALTPMQRGRWYPTSTTLPTGEVLTLAGTDEQGVNVKLPEVWTSGRWRVLTTASASLPYYPRAFVAPDGRVFVAGPGQRSRWLSTSGTGAWKSGPLSHYGLRNYGSAVMYAPGKVLIVGGGGYNDPAHPVPTNTAEVIDLNQRAPAWRYTNPMAFARRQMNATLLADGKVLATGGTSRGGFSDPAGAVLAAEIWNPLTERWTTVAPNAVPRLYHSTTILLPDARVLHAGSGDGGGLPNEKSAEIYSPPYLFNPDGSLAARPTITSAPVSVRYGQTFTVQTPNALSIASVTFIRLSAVTHAFNETQLLNRLALSATVGTLRVTAPARATLAPPGYYMLFIINAAGVPSVAAIILVQ
jgi:galactose oxidase